MPRTSSPRKGAPRLFDANQDGGPDRPSLFDFTSHTVQTVLDWYASQDAGQSVIAQKERERIRGLFASFVLAQGSSRIPLGEIPIAQCRPLHLKVFLEAMEAKGEIGAGHTWNRWLGTINAPFNQAGRLGLVPRNPFLGLKRRAVRTGRDLTDDEFRKLLAHSTHAFRLILLFCRHTGCRPGEAREITPEDVHLDKKVILRYKHKTFTKTGTPRRILLDDAMIGMVTKLLEGRRAGEAIFRNCEGEPWTIQALCKNVLRIRKKAGLSKDVKLYGCRHKLATELVLAGTSLPVTAEILGHNSVATTHRYYVHMGDKDDHLRAALHKAAPKEV